MQTNLEHTPKMDEFTFSTDKGVDVILAAYRKYGVVIVRQCLKPDLVDAIRKFLTANLESAKNLVASLGIDGPLAAAGPEIQALLNADAHMSSEQRHQLLGHFPLEVRLSEVLREIPKALGEQPFLRAIQGTNTLFAHMPINARWILPNQTYAAVPAHQDASYNAHMKGFSVIWTPFCEINERCGGMAFYPRSGARGLISQDLNAGTADWLSPTKVDTPRVVLQPISPGDVVVFDEFVVHESMPNLSNYIRLNVETRVFRDPSLTNKHYLDIHADKVVAPAAAQPITNASNANSNF